MFIIIVSCQKKFVIEIGEEETLHDVENILKEVYGFTSKLSFFLESSPIPEKNYFTPFHEYPGVQEFVEIIIKEKTNQHYIVPPNIQQEEAIEIGSYKEENNTKPLSQSSRSSKRLESSSQKKQQKISSDKNDKKDKTDKTDKSDKKDKNDKNKKHRKSTDEKDSKEKKHHHKHSDHEGKEKHKHSSEDGHHKHHKHSDHSGNHKHHKHSDQDSKKSTKKA